MLCQGAAVGDRGEPAGKHLGGPFGAALRAEVLPLRHGADAAGDGCGLRRGGPPAAAPAARRGR